MARKSGSIRRPVSSVVARIKPMGAGMLMLMLLAACSSPPTSNTTAPEAPASISDATSPPVVTPAAPEATTTATNAEVDPSQLPEDVRDYILKQRMCRHFSRPAAEGGNPAMTGAMCAGADETTWKALLRKYQEDDSIGSVLLAERPPTGTTE